MKQLFNFALVIALVAGFFYFYYGFGKDKQMVKPVSLQGLSSGTDVTCRFSITQGAYTEADKAVFGFPNKESNELITTFVNLDSDMPRQKSLGASDTTYDSNLLKLVDTPEKYVLVELTPTEKNIFTYTIFKKSGIGLWSKQYALLGEPSAMQSIGECR